MDHTTPTAYRMLVAREGRLRRALEGLLACGDHTTAEEGEAARCAAWDALYPRRGRVYIGVDPAALDGDCTLHVSPGRGAPSLDESTATAQNACADSGKDGAVVDAEWPGEALPDCMMPDGGQTCAGYQALQQRAERREQALVEELSETKKEVTDAEAEAATLRDELRKCRSRYCGIIRRGTETNDDLWNLAHDFYRELMRIDAIAREALQSAPPASEQIRQTAEALKERDRELAKRSDGGASATDPAQDTTRATTGERRTLWNSDPNNRTPLPEMDERVDLSAVVDERGEVKRDPAPADRPEGRPVPPHRSGSGTPAAHDPIADAARYGMGFSSAPPEDVWKRPEPSEALEALEAAEKAGVAALRALGSDALYIAAETGFLVSMDRVRRALSQPVAAEGRERDKALLQEASEALIRDSIDDHADLRERIAEAVGLAAAPTPEPSETVRYQVHVTGPDELHDFDSEIDALREANALNRLWLERQNACGWDPNAPIMVATVWPLDEGESEFPRDLAEALFNAGYQPPEPSEALEALERVNDWCKSVRTGQKHIYQLDVGVSLENDLYTVHCRLSQPVPAAPDAVRRLPEELRGYGDAYAQRRGAEGKAFVCREVAKRLERALADAAPPAEEGPWIIVTRQGLVPFRKRPISASAHDIHAMLTALYEQHPDATCTLIWMQPHGPEPQSGNEWLDMYEAAAPEGEPSRFESFEDGMEEALQMTRDAVQAQIEANEEDDYHGA